MHNLSEFIKIYNLVLQMVGDSDTLAAITGSIAEAAYGIPEGIKDKALSYLDEPIRDTYHRWCKFTQEG